MPHFREETGEVMNRVTVVRSVDDVEAWPPEFAKYSATTVAETVDTTVAKSVVEAQPQRIAKYSASTEFEFAVSCGESGSVGPGANDTISVFRHSRRKVCW